jgi:hypothetical protein
MLLLREYNQEKRLDRAWYSSSNIVYLECEDHENELKTLRVVFKNGSCYEYKEVSVMDYLMFMHGGLDGSNGKALNSFIKTKKYEYEKKDDADLSLLTEEMNKIINKRKENQIQTENNTDTNEKEA